MLPGRRCGAILVLCAMLWAAPVNAAPVTLANGVLVVTTVPSVSYRGDNTNGLSLAFQSFQLVVSGTGAVAATAQIVSSNDGVNWTPYGPAWTASGTASASATAYGSAPFEYWGVLITAISGTGAAATVKMSGAP